MFFFLDTLKLLLPMIQTDFFVIEQWDKLTEAYIDIMWNLRDQLTPSGKTDPLVQSTTKEHIEGEMHRLCAHFSEAVGGGLERGGTGVNVLCSKKYGSPCHRLNI